MIVNTRTYPHNADGDFLPGHDSSDGVHADLPVIGSPPPADHIPPSPSLLNLLTLYRDGLRKLAEGCKDSDAVLYAELRLAASHLTAGIRHRQAKEFERLEQEDLEAALGEEGR